MPALTLPERPGSSSLRALAAFAREEFTGLTTAAVTVSHAIVQGVELVFKNGTLVRPSTYTISGTTITLGSALLAGDWVVVHYYFRPS